MKTLSKSKILSYRQCPKQFWLSIHKPELAEISAADKARLATGNVVGEFARTIYDPEQLGTLVEPFVNGFDTALEKTQSLLNKPKPIFEATFSANGGLVMADVLLPDSNFDGNTQWKMIEVKATASVKDYHLDDLAVQTYVTKAAGVSVSQVTHACVDSKWTYSGDGNYQGLLKETDLSDESLSRQAEVATWFEQAFALAEEAVEPVIALGEQCKKPFDCVFLSYCSNDLPKPEFPVSWLPRIQTKALKAYIQEHQVTDMQQVPDDLLNATQQKVKRHTVSDTVFFDHEASKQALAQYDAPGVPAFFLDFETTNLAVPIWKGARPFQQVVFQFSCHKVSVASDSQEDELGHTEFLDISGDDPSEACVKQLLHDCETAGPIYVYNASFEKGRIKDLAKRFPDSAEALLGLNERMVDLHPIAQKFYYHPSQQGSWSIKKVLPAIAPDLDYSQLQGVQDGGMAMDAFIEAIHVDTSDERKAQIKNELLKYCELDTYAMVRMWEFFR